MAKKRNPITPPNVDQTEVQKYEQIETVLTAIYAQLKEINLLKAQGLSYDQKLRKELLTQIGEYKEQQARLKEAIDLVDDQQAALNRVKDNIADISTSFRRTVGISSKVSKEFNALQGFSINIAENLKSGVYSSAESTKAAEEASRAMNSYADSVSSALRDFKNGESSAEGLNEQIKHASEAFHTFISDLDTTDAEILKIAEDMKKAASGADEITKNFSKSKKELSQIREGIGEIASDAAGSIPGLSGMGSAIMSMGSAGVVGGIIALGLAFNLSLIHI